jgi:hypothetical protein
MAIEHSYLPDNAAEIDSHATHSGSLPVLTNTDQHLCLKVLMACDGTLHCGRLTDSMGNTLLGVAALVCRTCCGVDTCPLGVCCSV